MSPMVKFHFSDKWKFIAEPATIKARHIMQPIVWDDHMIIAKNGITSATYMSIWSGQAIW
jgi:hypothetical protein